jgi:hypothetical protein
LLSEGSGPARHILGIHVHAVWPSPWYGSAYDTTSAPDVATGTPRDIEPAEFVQQAIADVLVGHHIECGWFCDLALRPLQPRWYRNTLVLEDGILSRFGHVAGTAAADAAAAVSTTAAADAADAWSTTAAADAAAAVFPKHSSSLALSAFTQHCKCGTAVHERICPLDFTID